MSLDYFIFNDIPIMVCSDKQVNLKGMLICDGWANVNPLRWGKLCTSKVAKSCKGAAISGTIMTSMGMPSPLGVCKLMVPTSTLLIKLVDPPNVERERVSWRSTVRPMNLAKLLVMKDRWEPSSNKMCKAVNEILCSIGEMTVFSNVDMYLFSFRCWIDAEENVAGKVVVGLSLFSTGLVLTVFTDWSGPLLLWSWDGVFTGFLGSLSSWSWGWTVSKEHRLVRCLRWQDLHRPLVLHCDTVWLSFRQLKHKLESRTILCLFFLSITVVHAFRLCSPLQ